MCIHMLLAVELDVSGAIAREQAGDASRAELKTQGLNICIR